MTRSLERRTARRFWTGVGQVPTVSVSLAVVLASIHFAAGLTDLYARRTGVVGVLVAPRSEEVLRAWGARVEGGEVWRFLAYGGLHGDIVHIGLNLMALVGLGRIAESVFGGLRTLWIVAVAVVAGGVGSWFGGVQMSVGVSGGVFGLTGALVSYGWVRRRGLPPELRELFGPQLYRMIGLNLVLGLPLSGVVDNWAHVGGLLGGAAVAPFLADQLVDNRRPGVLGTVGIWAALGVGLLGVGVGLWG